MGRAPTGPAAASSVDVTVERLGLEGEGISTYQGRALFISGAYPTERVRVRLESGGKVSRGRLEAVLAPSPERRTAPCPLAGRCGGCDWMELKPATQVQEKERLVVDALTHLGRIKSGTFTLLPTAGAGTDTGTRRRAVLHRASEGLGYFGRRSHEVVPVGVCPALVPTLAPLPAQLARELRPLLSSLKAVHLVSAGGSVSLALALNTPVRPKTRELAEALVRSGLTAGVALLEPRGRVEEVGRPILESAAPGRPEVQLRLRADGFAQAHDQGAELLVERALQLLSPKEEDNALELYAGNGTFTFALGARAASVLAVESSPLSLALGAAAGRAAGVANVRWVQGDAAKVTAGLAKEGRRFDVLLADPPRTGAPKLAQVARGLGLRRLVYVGCDAGSLARDASSLISAGFRLETLQLVDLFPNTHHVEALLAFAA